ncbi:hypothetical protein [Pedobacter boryungensis]|uniref:DUF4468 domain-containing protein n=1 Tax=Pedobacter boryungensis TaxID=869962 RepID=A0ABX2DEI7_9SPHI|nr:hypothetical protein [Pedobacter boryungensis]NQX32227.1 hypothetical protein [Pedobacter boryungensis]
MKKALFIPLIFISTINFCYSQINFDNLLTIQRSDVGTITNFLIDKNWQLIESTEETEEAFGTMKWGYSVNNYETEKAELWLNIDYSSEVENRVSLQVHNKIMYQNIKAKALSYGMKKIGSNLKDGFAFTDYAGKNFVIRIGISSNSTSRGSIYHFILWSKNDYINTLEKNKEVN